jgi:hypothetical protein
MTTIAQDIANRYVGSNLSEISSEISDRCVLPTIQDLNTYDTDNYSTYEFSDGSTLVIEGEDDENGTEIRAR